MAVYDVDKNGTLDLVGLTGYVPGDGAGHFGSLVAFAQAFASGVTVADLNGDSLPDVAGTNSSHALSVVFATSAGVFATPTTFTLTTALTTATQSPIVQAVDVNHDGKLDVVEATGSEAVAWTGNGAGGFQEGTPAPASPSNVPGLVDPDAAVGDFDGDGNADVAMWGTTSEFVVGYGDGTGNFAFKYESASPAGNAVAADFNHDGRFDFAIGTAGPCAPTTDVFLSNGRTLWPSQPLRSKYDCVFPAPALVAGDLNGDGVPDLVVASPNIGSSSWTLQGYLVGL